MLWLGTQQSDQPLELPVATLLRHVAALGGSGSGKTVLCKVIVEEAARNGVGAICIDPQGDLCSLLLDGDPAELAAKGIPSGHASAFREGVEVLIWTPASSKGIPLSIDPVEALPGLDATDRTRAISRMAGRVASLLGYDLGSDDGQGLVAVLDFALSTAMEQGDVSLERLGAQLSEHTEHYASLLSPRKIEQACQRLARLNVGARRLLFHDGIPLDIETLLRAPDGRPRISVVYLNTLDHAEDKEFLIATLVERLYSWMLAHPSEALQALFYIDEVAPFLPPVRKPACKDGLQLLFKQARKYGVGCLMATQNPGDVDYKSLAQFSTWALGRITTRQDRKKVEPTVRGLAGDDTDALLDALPGQGAGELVLLSPDHLPAPTPFQTRWLYSRHETLNETRIAELMAGPRDALRRDSARSSSPVKTTPRSATANTTPRPPEPQDAPSGVETLAHLASVARSSLNDLATAIGSDPETLRRTLQQLVDAGSVRTLENGDVWTPASGARPDLDLGRKVFAVRGLDASQMEAIALSRRRSKTLGVLGDDEFLASVDLEYRMVYKLDFEETVQTNLLRRIAGEEFEHRLGSLYFHPAELSLMTFRPSRGIAFSSPDADVLASEVEDLDGHVDIVSDAPGALPLRESDVRDRRSVAELQQVFEATYEARPSSAALVFVPIWRFLLKAGSGHAARQVVVDGIVGRDVVWP
ncbi:MAG: helicase HerA-like domain-containing protein [Myxococcota bacterium]